MANQQPNNDFSFHQREKRYTVDFYGGPLDGARIETDICPNAEVFVHRTLRNQVAYSYQRLDGSRFLASCSQGLVEAGPQLPARDGKLRYWVLGAALLSLVGIVALGSWV